MTNPVPEHYNTSMMIRLENRRVWVRPLEDGRFELGHREMVRDSEGALRNVTAVLELPLLDAVAMAHALAEVIKEEVADDGLGI